MECGYRRCNNETADMRRHAQYCSRSCKEKAAQDRRRAKKRGTSP